jgi:hypothetical protein
LINEEEVVESGYGKNGPEEGGYKEQDLEGLEFL